MCLFCIALVAVSGCFGYLLAGKAGALAGFIFGLISISVLFELKAKYWRRFSGRPKEWLRARLGWGKSVAELARRLDMFPAELEAFQPAYKEVYISKRNGGKRQLLVPNDVTKVLQRRFLRRLLSKLRVHPAAQGFVKDRSAIKNAAAHAGQAVVITLDIVDFFSATSAARIEAYFRRIGWDAKAAKLLTRLTTWNDGLPQGAPTSPALSNLVNFSMDTQIAKKVAWEKGTYTRYADDIAISYPLDYPKTIHSIVDKVKRVVKSKGYRMHTSRKLRIRRQHQRQVVTGLVVNAKPQLPRKMRRWLRAVENHLATDRPATLSESQLNGWRAYQKAIQTQSAVSELKQYRIADNRKVIARRKKQQRHRKPDPS